MCGICAGIGKNDQIADVISGLKKLEYRGYDSSGIAFLKDKKLEFIKSVGQIKNLEKKIPNELKENIVIGHTRWATHGKVCEENAHPHLSENKKIAVVHNGIIENYESLKTEFLSDKKFYSQTDTEIFANLIELQKGKNLAKLIQATKLVKGSFAVAMLAENDEKIYLAKKASPLYVAINNDDAMASSDISVFANKFDNFYILEDDEFAVINSKNVCFYDKNGKKIKKNSVFLNNFDFKEENLTEKYFMLKEIKEQPMVLRKTYFKYFAEDFFSKWDLEIIKKFKQFHFVACGTAYHSALLGAQYVQTFCKKECKVSIASEFRYGNEIISKNCLYIFVSQSGETADTIACANLVKNKGCKIMCVTNVPYCTLNKLADFVLPTFAGKEIAVASTKAYVAQVFTMLIFALKLADKNFQEQIKQFVLSYEIPSLDKKFLKEIFKFEKLFFIGRQKDYVTSLEAALKLKEIAYINCLGIASGELKHGTLALIDEDTLVVAISTEKSLKDKVESNLQEVKARGGKILLVSNLQHDVEVEFLINIATFADYLMPIVSIVPLQQLAFEYAISQGYNPDKPRNLAKSVTVE